VVAHDVLYNFCGEDIIEILTEKFLENEKHKVVGPVNPKIDFESQSFSNIFSSYEILKFENKVCCRTANEGRLL